MFIDRWIDKNMNVNNAHPLDSLPLVGLPGRAVAPFPAPFPFFFYYLIQLLLMQKKKSLAPS
jgi:hypothetical protein